MLRKCNDRFHRCLMIVDFSGRGKGAAVPSGLGKAVRITGSRRVIERPGGSSSFPRQTLTLRPSLLLLLVSGICFHCVPIAENNESLVFSLLCIVGNVFHGL